MPLVGPACAAPVPEPRLRVDPEPLDGPAWAAFFPFAAACFTAFFVGLRAEVPSSLRSALARAESAVLGPAAASARSCSPSARVITSSGVDHIGSYWPGYNDTAQSVDMNGTDAGLIWQEFDTIVGQEYEVSFALSRNSDGP